MILLIISLRFHIGGQSEMKKCHECGKTQDSSVKKFREVGDECYCSFCLDPNGKPKESNPVHKSIMSFWRERDSEDQESKKHGS